MLPLDLVKRGLTLSEVNDRKAAPVWLWALAPMLLAAALAVPFLGRDIFDVDEAATLISACAHHLGPCTPAEAARASTRWPDNSWGLAIAFSQWGQLVGWSEFAMRALPWLIGPLTLGWVYRLGRDLFTPAIALAATLLLASSVLFLTYMHIARFYVPAMLLATITLWGYWRVALAANAPGRGAKTALLVGATGVLYAQYFGALLVPALGLFHLFLVRRDRRWRQGLTLLVLALLLALPQAPDLISGIAHNQGKEGLHARALQAHEILSLFLRYLSSDLLNVPQVLAGLLLPALPLFLLLSWRRGRPPRPRPGPARLLAVTTALQLLFIMGFNQWAQVFGPTRVRYLATLWPAALLLVGLALPRPPRPILRRPVGIALVLAMALAGVSDFLQSGPLVRTSWAWRDHAISAATMKRALQNATNETLLVVDHGLIGAERHREAYVSAFDGHGIPLSSETQVQYVLRQAGGSHEVILLLLNSREAELNLQALVDLFLQRLWIQHETWRDGGITFVRFVTPFSTLLIDRNRLEFDREVTLVGSGILHETDKIRFLAHFHSADDSLLADYSLAVHVIDPSSGERVAQSDSGVGPGGRVRTVSDVDLSALPPGVYEVQVALYDWRTGERLIARDLLTGLVSDMHALQRFHRG